MARRRTANGMGNIMEIKKENRWRWKMMIGRAPKTGKPQYVYRYAKTKAEVVKMRDEYLAEQRQGLCANKNPNFKEFADRWLENHRTGGYITETTAIGYEYTLRSLNEYFGKRKIKEITTPEIDAFLRKLRQKKSDSSVSKHRAMLSQIFNEAVGYRLILVNPVAAAKKKHPVIAEETELEEKEKDSFTKDELIMLMQGLDESDLFQAGMKLALGTGMRIQELLALKIDDIAEDGSCINIKRAVKLVRGKVKIGDTKNKPSKREIPVPEAFHQCALRLRQEKGDFIYALQSSDKPCNPKYFREKYYKHLERIGVRKLTPHCMRHTYVSQLQAAGVPMETIKKLTGHSQLATTEKYLHVQPEVLEKAVAVYSVFLTAA